MRIEEEPFTRFYYYMHLINKYTGTNEAMELNECIKNVAVVAQRAWQN